MPLSLNVCALSCVPVIVDCAKVRIFGYLMFGFNNQLPLQVKYNINMKKMRITRDDYIKANRKASREAEIQDHTHPISFKRVHKSKKVYDRKRSKAENKKALPYLFLVGAPPNGSTAKPVSGPPLY
jgi:hypothetical protein